jgi:hypothetical protein
MIEFKRYPHVGELVGYYAVALGDVGAQRIVENGVSSGEDAEYFSRFIWHMVDRMREDMELGRKILGRTDNSDMLPDVHYEISLYMKERGFGDVWERVCDEV